MRALNRRCGVLLWMYLLTVAQCAEDCALEAFKTGQGFHESFDLSNLKQSYAYGDVVRVKCQVGYSGFVRLICSKDGWEKKGDICRAISCGHPGDVSFADFALVKGSDYVFGSQVRYTCHSGYQMTSRSNSRNCLQNGWDGHLPVCEPILCPALTLNSKLQVYGDIDQPTSGSVLQFSCRNRGDQLDGAPRIFCDENGQWSNEMPSCREISCPKPQLDNFQLEHEKTVYRENDVLRYSCDERYIKVDGRPSVCRKQGQTAQWTPMPQCEPITCRLSLNPPMGTTYEPQNQMKFTPGQSARVTCGPDEWVKNTELQTADLICQETGLWDFEPECRKVICQKTADHVNWWDRTYDGSGYRRRERQHAVLKETLRYECDQQYKKTSERATCTRRGWEPTPLCEEKGCTKPSYKNAEIRDSQSDKYINNDRVTFECTYDKPTVSFYRDCYYGEWRGQVLSCKEKPCATKPSIINGEILTQTQRTEYDHGESLTFRCYGKTDTFAVTCQSGLWKKEKSCDDPCTTKPIVRNAEMVTPERPPYPHGHSVSLRCTTGAKEDFSVSCQSGEWKSTHRCREQGECWNAEIANGFTHESNNTLYYACSPGFKLLSNRWWGDAPCVGGKWKTQECVANTDCGPVPAIPHLNVTYSERRFSEGFNIPIHCETGYHNLNVHLTMVTCTNGAWSSTQGDLKQICTPIEKTCDPPPKVPNALILAPFKKKYLSGTVLTYECKNNYTISEDATVQCNSGTWEQKSITCTATSEMEFRAKQDGN